MDKHEWDGGTHARCQLKSWKNTQILWTVASAWSYKWPNAQAFLIKCCSQKLVRVSFKKFLKIMILEKLILGTDVQKASSQAQIYVK